MFVVLFAMNCLVDLKVRKKSRISSVDIVLDKNS